MMLFLFSIAVSCLLIALAQGAVCLLSLAQKSAHRAKAARRSVQKFTGLPNREEVKNIYSLSDQFADRLREVVQS